MKTFAFIFFPRTIEQLRNFSPVMRMVPDFILRARLKDISPFKVSHLKRIRSAQGKEIQGYFIACPLISSSGQKLDEESILDKIISAANIAARLSADILGLDINLSAVIEKRDAIDRKLKMPFTSGDTLTSWSIFEAVYRVVRVKNIDLKKSTVAIISASSPVGSLCARKLSEYVAKIIFSANDGDKLRQLKEAIVSVNAERSRAIEVIVEANLDKAIKEADIIIDLEGISALDSAAAEKLKPGAIICTPHKAISRADITIINGGLIKLPYPAKLGIKLGLPKGIIFASIAETMLLAFEERFISYSWGENINLDKLEEIADLTVQHGFEVWVPQAPVL